MPMPTGTYWARAPPVVVDEADAEVPVAEPPTLDVVVGYDEPRALISKGSLEAYTSVELTVLAN